MNDCQADIEVTQPTERVDFCVANDESARRIEAVLGSLGYEPVRDLAQIQGELFEEAAELAAHRYRLSNRERQVLTLLLSGLAREAIKDRLGFSKATLKWHLHNIYTKLGVSGSEHALRRALHIDGDPRWLREPRLQREALELVVAASAELLAALASDDPDQLAQASARLEGALARARRLARLDETSST
jgi:DNA-binding CsgD family transcriptional regulator